MKLSYKKRRKAVLPGPSLSLPWFLGLSLPMILGICVFTYIPIVISLFYSFFDTHNSLQPRAFVGLSNYTDLLSDPNFQHSIVTFLVYTAIIVPLTFVTALVIALLLHSIHFGAIFFRTIVFIPTACSAVTAAVIWKLSIFNGVRFGLANTLLHATGWHKPIAWLFSPDPPWYWLVIVSLRMWLQVGFYVVLFLAALGRVDPQLYEAASVDGVTTAWKKFRYITWPSIRTVSTAIAVLLILNAFQAFDEFYNLIGSLGGYPPYARPPLIYLYYLAMGESQDFGHAGAGAFILILLIICLSSTRYIKNIRLRLPQRGQWMKKSEVPHEG